MPHAVDDRLRVGALRHRVTIQTPTYTQDAAGEATATYATLATVWASVNPLTADELMAAQGPFGAVSLKVRIRYRSDVAPKHRLSHLGRVLDIIGVIDPLERHEYLDLLCREAVVA